MSAEKMQLEEAIDNLRTHQASWGLAFTFAINRAENVDDFTYWQHELKVFEATRLALLDYFTKRKQS